MILLDTTGYPTDYFLLYRIEGDTVIVDDIFHELQDYENMIL